MKQAEEIFKQRRNRRRMAVSMVLMLVLPHGVQAQLEFKAGETPQAVFAGEDRPVAVKFHNSQDKAVETALRTRLYQASTSTVIPLGEPRHWKELQVLPGQTVLESTPLSFPSVENGTRFLVQWLDEKNKVLGNAEVMVYPTNLLNALKPLTGEMPLGVLDPQNQLKPLLKGLDMEFEDLEAAGLGSFSGKLAIIGPFQSKAKMREGLEKQVQALAKKGKAIVWIQPPAEKRDQPQPSFYSVPKNQAAVVVVQPDLIADLPMNPQSQLNLIYFCKLALHPENPTLPDPTN